MNPGKSLQSQGKARRQLIYLETAQPWTATSDLEFLQSLGNCAADLLLGLGFYEYFFAMSSSLSIVAFKYVSKGAITWLSAAASTDGLMGSPHCPSMWLCQRPLRWKRSSNHEHEGRRKEQKSRGLFIPGNPLGCAQTKGVQLEGKIRPYNMIQLIQTKVRDEEFLPEQKEASQGISPGCFSKLSLLHRDLWGICLVWPLFSLSSFFLFSFPPFFPFSSRLFCFWKNDILAPNISGGNTHIPCSSVLPRRQKIFLIITHDLISPAFPPLPRSFIIIIDFSGTYSQL